MEETKLEKDLEYSIINILSKITPSKSYLHFSEFDKVEDEYSDNIYLLTVKGGLKGYGIALFYLEDVEELVKLLMCRFSQVNIVSWLADNKNDTFEVIFQLIL